MNQNFKNSCSDEANNFGNVIMVGPFPPPVHGLAIVHADVRDKFIAAGVQPIIIDLSAKDLKRSLIAKFSRFPVVLRGLGLFLLSGKLRNATLYMSVSGGFGKFYEIWFLLIARLNSMRIYLHHNSYAYIDNPSILTHLLTQIAGNSAIHINQSQRMARCFKKCYSSVSQVEPISNAVFFKIGDSKKNIQHSALKTLGFISNIAEEKGVFVFLDLIAACEKLGLILNAKLAGPFQDKKTEILVHQRISELKTVEYVGPQFADGKDVFFNSIDVLVFPTLYSNETEGIVNHEAMCRGIPVIAYGRGCIPDFISSECGLVINPADEFVPAALEQIKKWKNSPLMYQTASKAAAVKFTTTLNENKQRWNDLLTKILVEHSY